MNTYIATAEVAPTRTQIDLTDLSAGWMSGLTINGLGCIHIVFVDDDFTAAILMAQPEGMPGPAALEEWKRTPMDVHHYSLVEGNETESLMAFERWVVEHVQNLLRAEYGYGPYASA